MAASKKAHAIVAKQTGCLTCLTTPQTDDEAVPISIYRNSGDASAALQVCFWHTSSALPAPWNLHRHMSRFLLAYDGLDGHGASPSG